MEDEVSILEKIFISLNPTDMLTNTISTEKLKLYATSLGLLEVSEVIAAELKM